MATASAPLEEFGYTAEHELLKREARRFLGDHSSMANVRALASDSQGYRPESWQFIANAGWLRLNLPERYGGAGLGYLALALLLEESGRALFPSPFFSSILTAIALLESGDETACRRWLPALASGELIGTVGLTEPDGSWEPESVTAVAEVHGDGYLLNGTKTHVPWASVAHLLVAPFQTLDRSNRALFVVELPPAGGAPGVRVTPEVIVDSTRRACRVEFEAAPVEAAARLACDGLRTLRSLHTHGFALLAAEMVGAAEAALRMTCDYACQRVQFDRPIGSFQAVKHPLVNVMIAVERARSLAYGAATTLDIAPQNSEVIARMAKAAAGQALSLAVDRGLQLHGGFGFTWDCDMHFYFKRALLTAATLGDSRHHRRHLAQLLRAGGVSLEDE
jgi:alkylation response protein AidB-like acyl-CoA dehydrogenase